MVSEIFAPPGSLVKCNGTARAVRVAGSTSSNAGLACTVWTFECDKCTLSLYAAPSKRVLWCKPTHKDLGRNNQSAITPKPAYVPVSNRTSSRSFGIKSILLDMFHN